MSVPRYDPQPGTGCVDYYNGKCNSLTHMCETCPDRISVQHPTLNHAEIGVAVKVACGDFEATLEKVAAGWTWRLGVKGGTSATIVGSAVPVAYPTVDDALAAARQYVRVRFGKELKRDVPFVQRVEGTLADYNLVEQSTEAELEKDKPIGRVLSVETLEDGKFLATVEMMPSHLLTMEDVREREADAAEASYTLDELAAKGVAPFATGGTIKGPAPLSDNIPARLIPLEDRLNAALAYALWDSENTTRMPSDAIEEHIERAKKVRHWLALHGSKVVPIVDIIGANGLKVFDRVIKRKGDYIFEGTVRTVFMKRSGVVRLVVESDEGLLLIFNPAQLEKLDGNSPPSPR